MLLMAGGGESSDFSNKCVNESVTMGLGFPKEHPSTAVLLLYFKKILKGL